MTRPLLTLVAELVVFAVAALACSFTADVHLVAAFIVGGVFALLIRAALVLGTFTLTRLRRHEPGQFWKVGGGWGEWRK